MSLCIYCTKQKGRRTCPALGGLICASCCGRHRGLRIHCPMSCRYFKSHEGYQRERVGEEFHQAWMTMTEPLYRQNKLKAIDFMAQIEIAIFKYYRDQTQGTDKEVVAALEFLKRRLSPVLIVEATATTLGNELLKAMEDYMKQEPSPLEEAQAALELLLQFVQAQTHPEDPRHALHGLLGQVDKYFELPPEIKTPPSTIVKPSIVTPDQLQ